MELEAQRGRSVIIIIIIIIIIITIIIINSFKDMGLRWLNPKSAGVGRKES